LKKAIIIQTAIFFLLFGVGLRTDAQNLDSLKNVWQDNRQPDSLRIKAYYFYIGNGFLNSQPDSALIMSERLIAFSKKNSYPKGEAMGLNFQGILYYSKGNYPKALEYWNRSLKVYEEVGDKKGISTTVSNIGNRYGSQGNYTKALEYYFRSFKIFEDIGDKSGMAKTLGNIGAIYGNQENYHKALEYSNRALTLFEEIGEKQGIASMLLNIGGVYEMQSNHSKALEYYNRSIIISEIIDSKRLIAENIQGMGKLYAKQDDFIKALDYFNRSLKILEEIGDKYNISENLEATGSLYLKQGKAAKAMEYCSKGLDLAEQIGALEAQKLNCQCLYDAYKTIGNGNEALVYLERINGISDSLHTEETNKQLQQMEFAKQVLQDSIAQAETDRLVLEGHQEEMLAEEKTRNIAFSIGGLLFLLAGGLYTRVRFIRKSRAIIEEEKDRSNNLLLNILPADIAEELKIHGKAEARDFDMVSILFTDFKGFTAASEKLSAQELVAEINTCFEAFDGIMTKYGIEKIKTIGDAYMAAGGLPVPTDDSVKNTVLAALEMQAFIGKRKSEMDAAGKPAFEMRVGIHTGPVVAGIVGVKKFQYDIWGDTVNTAARMESSGEVARVNISQVTYELLKDYADFTFESRGKIEAKGKGMIEMYFVSAKN
jgi:adenylate cyclase